MYEDIVKKYGRKFKYLCWDYEKYHDAKREELYQQVLLNIYVALDDFRGESSPYKFAYRVAINTCCNYVGKEKHESKQSLDYDFSLAGYEFKYEAMVDYKIMIEFASTFKDKDGWKVDVITAIHEEYDKPMLIEIFQKAIEVLRKPVEKVPAKNSLYSEIHLMEA